MNKQDILNYVEKKFNKNKHKIPAIGDTVRVHVKIKEGNTTRVQVFEGVVIAFKGKGELKTMTVRKISFGVGVERIFPIGSPLIEKLKILRSSHVRRSKLYYLRNRMGKASRLEEKEQGTEKSGKEKKSGSNPGTVPVQELAAAVEKK